MNSSSTRVAPLPPAEWPDEARAAFAVMDSQVTKDLGAAASNLVMTLANYPALARAYYTFGRHLLLESSLSPRIRELVTLRVARRYESHYEWHHHVRLGKRIGLTDEEIEAIRTGTEARTWSEADRCALRLADQLCERSRIDDATWNETSRFLDRRQLMDLVFTIGHYAMVAWAVSALGIEVEPDVRSEEHPLT